ncbi:hypothetical protein [Streptomyces niveus]|uniref:hypothetical protein n=1 Tax=Streptomyces niveus TaxID=193462 RepID=UPI003416834B
MTGPQPAAPDPFARARGLLEPEAARCGIIVTELVRRLARAARRHIPADTSPRGGSLSWALPQTCADLPADGFPLGPMSSGKAATDSDRTRAQLAAEGACFREETVTRGGREFTEFHVERPEAGQ